ncbi:hypothetical protein Dfri01_59300 [Dyadobacter frigoris]|nr:hypothetical protein Dfri01_59300 [Dyadobacter frigoris]
MSQYSITDDGQLSLSTYSVDDIISKYGGDAFEPVLLVIKGSEPELVPKLRLIYTDREWKALDVDYRMFILNEFYLSL